MTDALHELLREPHIWRATSAPAGTAATATGFAELDTRLPGGGWPRAALTEVIHAQQGIGELQLLMPALARLSRNNRWIALIAPPHIPYAPALAARGIDLSRVLLVRPQRHVDILWAVEQALRAGTCAAVICWPGQADASALRRLQLAAETGDCMGFLFRSEADAAQPSPATLRVRLRRETDGGNQLDLIKCRGSVGPQSLQLDLGTPRVRALPVSRTASAVRRRGPAPEATPARKAIVRPLYPQPRGTHSRVPQLQLPLDGERQLDHMH
ncbi:translesion DNA synthesis-associated protein ImuA [Methylonatrum kenyense]|uniref:translesion DNA synthesis-associated protein ImuA n=1 Tax=Methylonatrum kenyense TaxID=455253 RepID=UPI0020C0275B|nr:translesion DNA synthesis-associated protein ImuA [Methylonatrum kenyense]MCK8515893.1 translesion DNA synthesis-associated protein ImuA [Methylonatrum kenyense]